MVPAARGAIRPGPLRPLNVPQPIFVVTSPNGDPRFVQRGRRRLSVVSVRDYWRVDDRWWTEEPVERNYYELEMETGEVLTLFLDALAHRWYEQRVP
jgi:hypothetical protein